jgi:hypothetical protein
MNQDFIDLLQAFATAEVRVSEGLERSAEWTGHRQ